MIVPNLKSAGFYMKTRPKPHKLDSITTIQHDGYVAARLPKAYPITRPQMKVRRVADECGIRKGISRSELVGKMINCVGPKMRKGGAKAGEF